MQCSPCKKLAETKQKKQKKLNILVLYIITSDFVLVKLAGLASLTNDFVMTD